MPTIAKDYPVQEAAADRLAAVWAVPDPFAATFILGGDAPQVLRAAQRERRARILAAARSLIAEGGRKEVAIRAIASRANLSVQTIYNLVGNLDDVTAEAIHEATAATVKVAQSMQGYPNFLLAYDDLIWMKTVMYPDYIRAVAITCAEIDPAIASRMRKRQSARLRELLSERYGPSAREQTVDLDVLSHQIASSITQATIEWAYGRLTLEELRYRLGATSAISLACVAEKDERAEMFGWVQRLKPSA
ncbi:MAG: TetR family transcriptional regulator [Phenylobacterium sp.]